MWPIKSRPTRLKHRGFTLIELLITITIAAILAGLALPSFRDFILNQRVRSASFDLMAALTFTRSEAIKRNANVTMTQESGSWQNGWTVSAGSPAVTLRSWGPYPALSLTEIASETTIVYSKDGRANKTIKFTLDDNASNAAVEPRCINIDLSGRPNSKIGSC